jgi:hypothetical protein
MRGESSPVLLVASEPEGWDRPVRHRVVHVLFTDGGWRTAQVMTWRQGHRQWFVCLAWRSGQTSWHIYDRRYLHPA